jgi:lipoprotein-anchoring transpeptidase ErfK/SrfK
VERLAVIIATIIFSYSFAHAQSADFYPKNPKSIAEVNASGVVNVYKEFPIVIVVNKSPRGMFAQRAQLWQNGVRKAEFNVSTGRERWENPPSGEKYFSATPAGWFSPQHLERTYFSQTWKVNMDFAVFFNGGVALHATEPEHYAELGHRGSGGCVRMARGRAESIFNLIENAGKGMVPMFTPEGRFIRDSKGQIQRSYNWNTLIIVE